MLLKMNMKLLLKINQTATDNENEPPIANEPNLQTDTKMNTQLLKMNKPLQKMNHTSSAPAAALGRGWGHRQLLHRGGRWGQPPLLCQGEG
jgi:hypothetical protein